MLRKASQDRLDMKSQKKIIVDGNMADVVE